MTGALSSFVFLVACSSGGSFGGSSGKASPAPSPPSPSPGSGNARPTGPAAAGPTPSGGGAGPSAPAASPPTPDAQTPDSPAPASTPPAIDQGATDACQSAPQALAALEAGQPVLLAAFNTSLVDYMIVANGSAAPIKLSQNCPFAIGACGASGATDLSVRLHYTQAGFSPTVAAPTQPAIIPGLPAQPTAPNVQVIYPKGSDQSASILIGCSGKTTVTVTASD